MKFFKYFFVVIGVGLIMGYITDVPVVNSAPRLGPSVTKTSRNEGDRRAGFNVAVSSSGWTLILSDNPRRRNAVIQTASSASFSVCLSTFNTSTEVCGADTDSALLEAGGNLSEYSEQALYARGYDAASGSVNVRGLEYYDSADHPSYQ